MSVTVRIPTPLRKLTKEADVVSGDGGTLTSCIESLERQYPGLKERLCDEAGGLRGVGDGYVNGGGSRFPGGEGAARGGGRGGQHGAGGGGGLIVEPLPLFHILCTFTAGLSTKPAC